MSDRDGKNRETLVPGGFYRNRAGALYQVKTLAVNSQTKEKMVVYQEMFPPFTTLTTPLRLFALSVFPAKDFLCEGLQGDDVSEKQFEQRMPERKMPEQHLSEQGFAEEEMSEQRLTRAFLSGMPEKYLLGKLNEEEIAQQGFMTLLDAQTYKEKRQIYIGLKPYMNKRMLGNLAVAMDIVLEDGGLEEQYEAILQCLETFEKYEVGGRLRR